MQSETMIDDLVSRLDDAALMDLWRRAATEAKSRRARALADGAAQSGLSQYETVKLATNGGQHTLDWFDYCKVQMYVDTYRPACPPKIVTAPPEWLAALFGRR